MINRNLALSHAFYQLKKFDSNQFLYPLLIMFHPKRVK
ncbi:hypothetical protein BN133_4349 [Cronobacter dublinensis 582]|nr:hypothetical protein BN133_4349 [Cronobacter dublinensis 582]